MFHMLSCFNLQPDSNISAFGLAFTAFVDDMKRVDLVHSVGPVGRRQRNTPMDTDDERDHNYFVTMTFRDRAQVDAAYAHILKHVEPGEASHNGVYSKVKNPVFICWEDLI